MYKLETLLLLIDKLLNNTTRMTERKLIWEDSNWFSNYKTLCTISQGKRQLTTILLLEMKLECIVYNLHHISTYSIITTVQNKQLVSLSEYFTFKFWEEIFFSCTMTWNPFIQSCVYHWILEKFQSSHTMLLNLQTP